MKINSWSYIKVMEESYIVLKIMSIGNIIDIF